MTPLFLITFLICVLDATIAVISINCYYFLYKDLIFFYWWLFLCCSCGILWCLTCYFARKLWSQNQPPKKQDSEFVSYVLDAIARGQEKIGTNFKESDSDELDDSFAPPTKKPRLMWRQELHQQFVEDVMQIGLDSMINPSPLLVLQHMYKA